MKRIIFYFFILFTAVGFSQTAVSSSGATQQSSSYLLTSSLGEVSNVYTSSPFTKAGVLQWTKEEFISNNEEEIKENIKEQEEIDRIDSINAQGFEGLPGLVDAAGKSVTTNNLEVVYTLGEVVNASYTSPNYVLKQGVLQIAAVVVTDLAEVVELNSNVYPSPFRESITVMLSTSGQIVASLVSMQGNVMISKEVTSNEFTMNTTALPIGVYILEIIDETNGLKKSVKLLKSE